MDDSDAKGLFTLLWVSTYRMTHDSLYFEKITTMIITGHGASVTFFISLVHDLQLFTFYFRKAHSNELLLAK